MEGPMKKAFVFIISDFFKRTGEKMKGKELS